MNLGSVAGSGLRGNAGGMEVARGQGNEGAARQRCWMALAGVARINRGLGQGVHMPVSAQLPNTGSGNAVQCGTVQRSTCLGVHMLVQLSRQLKQEVPLVAAGGAGPRHPGHAVALQAGEGGGRPGRSSGHRIDSEL